MAEGVLGLGSSGSKGLNADVIKKLKEAETNAKVKPYDKKLEDWDKELETLGKINTQTNKFLEEVKKFDLYEGNANIFGHVNSSTNGSSVLFDTVDVKKLRATQHTVDIKQLATKDVFQSRIIEDPDEIVVKRSDIISPLRTKIIINTKDDTYTFDTLDKSYNEVLQEMKQQGIDASIQQVAQDQYRFVIKSASEGVEDSIVFEEESDIDLDFERILKAQNLKVLVNNSINYDISSNEMVLDDNIKITAVETGVSTLNIHKDDSTILPDIQKFITEYNSLVDVLSKELYSEDSSIKDRSSFKMMMSQIKDIIYASYGDNNDLSIFRYGFNIDKVGHISLNVKTFNEYLSTNKEDIKNLFIGVAENPGMGTRLKEYVDGLDSLDGLLSKYGDNMTKNKKNLEKEKKEAQEAIDKRYLQMSKDFASYTTIISKFENSFNGLRMMIQQSTANK